MKIQTPRALPLRDRIREVTSAAILDAAEHVVGEVGFATVSLQAIAERAGTAVGTIYNYFTDKKTLLDELSLRRHEELNAAIDETTRRHARAPFEAQLTAFVRTAFTFFDTHRQFIRAKLESEGARPVVEKTPDGKRRLVMQALTDRAELIMRHGVKEKKIRAESANLAAIALVATIRAVLIMKHDDDSPLAAETDAVVELILRGAHK